MYDTVLGSLTDIHVPAQKVTSRRQQFATWMDSKCRQLRRNSRRKSIDRRNVPTGTHNEQTMRDSQRNYGNTLSSVHGAPKSRQLIRNIPSAQDFLDFFLTMAENVRKDTRHGPAMTFLPAATSRMENCHLYTEADILATITATQSWSWVTFSKPNPTQNFWTQPNPTHKSLHPTQPNPSSTLGMAY